MPVFRRIGSNLLHIDVIMGELHTTHLARRMTHSHYSRNTGSMSNWLATHQLQLSWRHGTRPPNRRRNKGRCAACGMMRVSCEKAEHWQINPLFAGQVAVAVCKAAAGTGICGGLLELPTGIGAQGRQHRTLHLRIPARAMPRAARDPRLVAAKAVVAARPRAVIVTVVVELARLHSAATATSAVLAGELAVVVRDAATAVANHKAGGHPATVAIGTDRAELPTIEPDIRAAL